MEVDIHDLKIAPFLDYLLRFHYKSREKIWRSELKRKSEIKRISSDKNYLSDSPQAKVLKKYVDYCNSNNKQNLNLKLRTKTTSSVINEISFFINQGVQFLNAAEQSDIYSKPLLLYYAYLQLLKGLITSVFEVDWSEPFYTSHGLSRMEAFKPPFSYKIKTSGLLFLGIAAFGFSNTYNHFEINREVQLETCLNAAKAKPVGGIVSPYTMHPIGFLNGYITLFIMSELARYKPDIWHKLLNDQIQNLEDHISIHPGLFIRNIHEFFSIHEDAMRWTIPQFFTIWMKRDEYPGSLRKSWRMDQ